MTAEYYFTAAQIQLIELLREGHSVVNVPRRCKEGRMWVVKLPAARYRRADRRTLESLWRLGILDCGWNLTDLGRTIELRRKV